MVPTFIKFNFTHICNEIAYTMLRTKKKLCSLPKIDFLTLHINSTLQREHKENPAVNTINLDLNI